MSEADLPKLPDFDRPPVVETVLSAQFEPIAGMSTVHFGLFWQRIRDEFPRTDERPALEPAFERFEERPRRDRRFRIEVREDSRPQRMWFVNEPGTEMIQLQMDRFIKNWRKTGDDEVNPRYEQAIKPGFERHLGLFEAFLASEHLGPIKVNQCEVTYVNHIVAGDGWTNWSDAGKIFTFLGGMPESIEEGAFVIRMPMLYGGQPVGRLTVEIQPALRESDDQPMYVMNLTARGLAGTGTEFFDLGRAAIVKTFADLTAPAMHQVWRRRQ